MKPILLDDTRPLSELAADTSNGLGRLECLSAEVNEEANGVFTAELVYPVTGEHFKDLHIGGIVKLKANDTADLQMFRINKITKPLNGMIEIQCNHISYDLSKTSVLPFKATGAASAMSGIKSHMVSKDSYPFNLVTDLTNTTSKFKLDVPQSVRACLGGVEGSMLDVFGGEYEWDNLTVRQRAHRGADNGVRIAYGKNLTDIEQEESIEAMYTAVMPYASEQGGSGDSATICGDLQTIVAAAQPKILNLDLSDEFGDDETITKAKVNAKAQAYINANHLNQPSVSIDVEFVPLWQTEQYKSVAALERVSLFDTVHVYFEPLGIEASARVTEYEYDVLKERYIKIHLGNVKSSLASTIAQTQKSVDTQTVQLKSFMDEAIRKNTEMMTGVTGGHLYVVRDADGKITEQYWLDTDSIETAVNVRRENLNGIAFSHNGINGPFESAWLQDGTFTAEFMQALQINADQITGGTIDAVNINGSNITGSNFESNNGVYNLEIWAGVLSLLTSANYRASLYQSSSCGVLKLFSGTADSIDSRPTNGNVLTVNDNQIYNYKNGNLVWQIGQSMRPVTSGAHTVTCSYNDTDNVLQFFYDGSYAGKLVR